MEVKMQTSFIPKKPITESRPEGAGVSLFLILSIILFIVSIGAAGGVFVWQKSLIAQVEQGKATLASTTATYSDGSIDEIIKLDDRIEQSKILLDKHIAVTPIFTLLETKIVKNVQLKGMKFSYAGPEKIKIELAGIAKNYDALSIQSDAFGDQNDIDIRGLISQPTVTDFILNPDSTISFNFNAVVNSSMVTYKNSLTNNPVINTGSVFDSTNTTTI